MRKVDWYFDFVSPFAYFAFLRLKELPQDVEIVYRPVVFAAVLNHWEQKGPAEIVPKRVWTYRFCAWWAQTHGIAFRFPAAHPFNSLAYLRLAIAAGNTAAGINRIFESLWTTGADPAQAALLAQLTQDLGVDAAAGSATAVKESLRQNTDEAIRVGVFGVPSLVVAGQIFWGADGLDFAKAFLDDPTLLDGAEMRRVSSLRVGASRTIRPT